MIMRTAEQVLLEMSIRDLELAIELRKLVTRIYEGNPVTVEQLAAVISNVCEALDGQAELAEVLADFHDTPEMLSLALERGLSKPPT
jgi:hypothetical protein